MCGHEPGYLYLELYPCRGPLPSIAPQLVSLARGQDSLLAPHHALPMLALILPGPCSACLRLCSCSALLGEGALGTRAGMATLDDMG